METLNQELYFDPFADEGDQLFNPINAFAKLEERYLSGDVKHDYTADNFVRDTEALMLDAAFVEQFDAVQAMAARMHQLCGGHNNLQQSLQNSDVLTSFLERPESHSKDDGHGHAENLGDNHDLDHDHSIGDDEKDTITGKKKKKKKKKKGWFGVEY